MRTIFILVLLAAATFAKAQSYSWNQQRVGSATDGPPAPSGYYGWTTIEFAIPSAESDVPRVWVLNAPAGYTWQDLMRNIDGIRFWMIDPAEVAFDACWEFGADNITITYQRRVVQRKPAQFLGRI